MSAPAPAAGRTDEVVVACDDVVVTYGPVRALDLPALRLTSGVTGLVGVNGAGKTTLLRCLTGSITPDQGQVTVLGTPLRRDTRRTVRREVGLAPQSFTVPGGLTVAELVTYFGWLHGLSSRDAVRRCEATLAELDLADRGGAKVRSLSGGMLRRVAIAQAVVHQPALVLLDEPTAGLDPEQRHRIRELVPLLAPGHSVVVSSHIMEDIVKVSDRILLLDNGKVRFHGTLDEFWHRARTSGAPDGDAELAFLSMVGRDV